MVDLSKGLVGHWTMDDRDTSGGTLYDRSAYDNHMSIGDVSTVASSSGKIGTALNLSDNNSSVLSNTSIPSSFGSRIATCSVSFWMKGLSFSGSNNYDANIFRTSGTSIDKLINIYGGRDGESVTFERRDDSNGFHGKQTVKSDWGSSWHHIVCIYDESTGLFEIWVNGELDSSSTDSFTPTDDFTELDISDGGVNGTLDDIRLYDRYLSADEVNALYQMRSPRTRTDDLSKGLVGHWTCDASDVNNGTFYDSSAYNNNGTIDGDVSVDNDGIIDEAHLWDANGDSVDIPSSDSLTPTDEITLSMWLKLNSSTDDNGNTSHHLFKGDYGLIHSNFFVEDSNNNRIGVNASPPTDGSWHHAAMTYDGSVVQAYIDASKSGSVSNTDPINISSRRLQIGNAGGNNWTTDGSIDDVRVYDRALSESEINRLYNKRT